MNLQLGRLWASWLVEYEGRLCTYKLAVFGLGSLLCMRGLAVFGPGSLLCMRIDCALTGWQSLGQVACCE